MDWQKKNNSFTKIKAMDTKEKREKKVEELESILGLEVPLDDFLLKFRGKVCVNVMALDTLLSENDPEYDCRECVFRGESNYSMSKYITEKYGNRANDLIEDLLV